MTDYLISVVMASYNSGEYLEEALQSVIRQDIGFENIQVIIVDDGSTDNSADIIRKYCREYPDNVFSVFQSNSGASSARNVGLKLVKGKYISFLDSDDRLSLDAYRKMTVFFEEHYQGTDLVSIPLVFFDQQNNEHHLNYKYRKGSRLIDLMTEWDAPQMSAASCLFKKESIDQGFCFDERTKYAEDMKFVLQILSQKKVLGVVSDAKYYYRRRSGSNQSVIQRSIRDKNWYVPCLKYSYWESMEYYLNRYGSIPLFVQNTICTDLQWKIIQEDFPYGILSEEEKEEYKQLVRKIISHMDTDIILRQKYMDPGCKLSLLKLKENKIDHSINDGKPVLMQDDQIVYSFCEASSLELCFIELLKDKCVLEGRLITVFDQELPFLILKKNEEKIRVKMEFLCHKRCIVNQEASSVYTFKAEIGIRKDDVISFSVLYGDNEIDFRKLDFGKFMPLSSIYEHMCYRSGLYLVYRKDGKLIITQNNVKNLIVHEFSFLRELSKDRNENMDLHDSARKALFVRPLIVLNRLFKRRKIYLFRDRINIADDNAFAMFEFFRERHPEKKSIFVISKTVPDYQKVKKIGNVIDCLSWKYKMLYLASDYMISSAADDDVFNPFEGHNEPYKDLLYQVRFVFLQHGVIHDDISDWLNRYNINAYGFVCSSKREEESLKKRKYLYHEDNIWLTGLPRFDNLKDHPKKIITFVPTWRIYDVEQRNKDGIFEASASFCNSAFYKNYHRLFNDKELMRSAKERGYKLQLLLHPSMRAYEKVLDIDPSIEIADEKSYGQIYEESDLLVTDYSSSVFDFAFMKKPVLYFQFDKEEFYKMHMRKQGYFSFEEDGFGEVETNENDLVLRIKEYMDNGCKMKEKYIERAESFFEHHDRNNRQRVYERIIRE